MLVLTNVNQQTPILFINSFGFILVSLYITLKSLSNAHSMIFTGGAIADILVGHKAEITALGITSEGMRAISASLDNTMKMWDLRTGKVTKTINGVGKDVLQVRSCLQFS